MMIEIQLYRIRIGGHYLPHLAKKPRGYCNKRFNFSCLDVCDYMSITKVSQCLLYLYFVTVVSGLTMSMSLSLANCSKTTLLLPLTYQYKSEFYNHLSAIVYVKYLSCIIISNIYIWCLDDKHARSYIL